MIKIYFIIELLLLTYVSNVNAFEIFSYFSQDSNDILKEKELINKVHGNNIRY